MSRLFLFCSYSFISTLCGRGHLPIVVSSRSLGWCARPLFCGQASHVWEASTHILTSIDVYLPLPFPPTTLHKGCEHSRPEWTGTYSSRALAKVNVDYRNNFCSAACLLNTTPFSKHTSLTLTSNFAFSHRLKGNLKKYTFIRFFFPYF